jgi:arsenate reductase (glutaredoxin)
MKNLPIMKKIYYLKTCDTCKKILKSLPNISEFVLVDIKENPLTAHQLEELYNLTQSYEVLFSRKAKLYKEMGLKDFDLTEADYKRYILEHYTFLSRPVIVDEQNIFVGSSPKTLQAIAQHFAK